MIKINNKEYKYGEFEISWGEFFDYTGEIQRTGIAPRISFNIYDIFIELELTFSKEMFENTNIGIKTDISSYVSDIAFEDKDGWLSINDGKYNLFITRINEKKFNIDFNINAHDLDEEFNIIINEDIDIF